MGHDLVQIALPPFLTADYLRDLLNWPRSHQRKFIEKVSKSPFPESKDWRPTFDTFYNALIELLGVVGGGLYFSHTARSFDPDYRRRCIEGRIFQRVRALGDGYPPIDSPEIPNMTVGKIRSLVLGGQVALAGQLAWSWVYQVAGLPDDLWPVHSREIFDSVSTSEPEVLDYLGSFWDNLTQNTKDESKTNVATPLDSDKLDWSESRKALVRYLENCQSPNLDQADRIIDMAASLRSAAELETKKDKIREEALINFRCKRDDLRVELNDLALNLPGTISLPSVQNLQFVSESKISTERLFILIEHLERLAQQAAALRVSIDQRSHAAQQFASGAVGALEAVIEADKFSQATVDTFSNAATELNSEIDALDGFPLIASSDLALPFENISDEVQYIEPTLELAAGLKQYEDSEKEEDKSDETFHNAKHLQNDAKSNEYLIDLHLENHISAADFTDSEETAPCSVVIIDAAYDESRSGIYTVLTELISQRHFSLAYEISRAAIAAFPDMLLLAPPLIFRALAIGNAVRGTTTLSASDLFDEIKEPLFDTLVVQTEDTSPAQLLGFSAALRPAIFSPNAAAGELVRWGGRHDALYELGKFVADLTVRLGRPLTVADLAPVRDRQLRVQQALTATTALLSWAESAAKQTMKYAPATMIWSALFKSGELATALSDIRGNHNNQIKSAQAAVIFLKDPAGLLEKLDTEPRSVLRIEAGSRQRLLAKMADAASQLNSWLDAHIALSEGDPSRHFSEQTAELHRLLHATKARVEGAIAIETSSTMEVALNVVTNAIDDLLVAFDGQTSDVPLSLDQKLNDELLLPRNLPHQGLVASEWSRETALAFLTDFQASPLLTYSEAFLQQIDLQQFEAASRILERLRVFGEDINERSIQLDHVYDAARHDLQRQISVLRSQIDILLGADIENVIESSLSNRLDVLSVIFKSLPSADVFADLAELIDQVAVMRVEVETAYEVLIDPLRAKIFALELSGNDVAELNRMAERRDLATLAEHIEALENGHALQPIAASGILAEYGEYLSRDDQLHGSLAELRKAIDSGSECGPFNFSSMPSDERKNASSLIGAWTGLRTGQYGDQTGQTGKDRAIVDLLTRLGFASVKVTKTGAFGSGRAYSINTEPLEDRKLCAIPAFGSMANGRYNVIVVEQSVTDDLFSTFQKHADPTGANVLLFLGSLSKQRRSQLIQAARRETNGAATAFMDESGVVFLASRLRRKMSDFFDLAIPQGSAQPYSDKAAHTSVEMFFGRREELMQLWNPQGSCLVYGGRQLGKTALLRQLVLQYHNPPHQYVLYGSYDEYGEGGKYPTTDFWKKIGELMVEADLTKSRPAGRAQVEERILDFLNKDASNRIVILIDEADKILKSEIQDGYRNIAPIKANLMERTGYRCKFIFAGLHDVQRSARSPNSPLLHFGKAIEVGPLFRSDIQQAWEMVERPLNAVGYYFQDRSLIGRILSLVGYYPSFVQSFCKGLIERLNKRLVRKMPDGIVPFKISVDDVDDAARDETFSGSLQEKFEATLNLDERYRLITYALLIEGFEKRINGYTDVEVQRLALKWWAPGFMEDASLDAFQGLLDEMVGLGVLVRQPDGRYLIRSARIAAMLGGTEQINQKIIELVDRPRPPVLDPGHIRRLHEDRVSPLNERQERILLDSPNPIHVAVGSTALGFEWLAPHIERLSENLPEDQKFQTFRKIYHNSRDLLKVIDAAAADVQRGNTQRKLAWVVATGAWPDTETLTKVAQHNAIQLARRGKANSVRLIIVPNDAHWRTLAKDVSDGSFIDAAILPLAPLGDSALHFWIMATTGSAPSEEDVAAIKRITGGFVRYLPKVKSGKISDVIEASAKDREKRLKERNIWIELGVDDPDLMTAIQECYELGGIDEDLLLEAGVEEPADILQFLVALGIMERNYDLSQYALNPFIFDLIKSGLHAK